MLIFSIGYGRIPVMSVEDSKDSEVYKEKPRYFIGSLDDPLFADTKGYFMGGFMGRKILPEGGNILVSEAIECAVMELPQIDPSPPHYHKLMTEITYCLSGRLHLIIEGENIELGENQFMVIPPEVVIQNPENDPGTRIFVVKVPSVPDDKFYV